MVALVSLRLGLLTAILCNTTQSFAEEGPRVALPMPSAELAREVLDASFAHRFEVASAERIRMVRRFKDQREVFTMESARKQIGEKLHSLVRFSSPAEYRGWRVLTIEAKGRSDDHFIYMRSQGKVRRVRALPADSFFGTDFALEDMEKRTADDFEVYSFSESVLEGELVYIVAGRPLYDSRASLVEIVIGQSDGVQLAVRSYRKGAKSPSKEVVFPRQSIQEIDGVFVATHIVARNLQRGTETHAYVEQVSIRPDLPDSLFSVMSLHSDRPIPGL